ncbi:MAG: ATP-binding protein, partial [Roseiflexaceae bacterium]
MKRLRTVDVHVSDVVAALQAQGVSITRARFDDLLLMRPERDISASCELFASVIAVMFMFHAQALTTAEFFTLAIAMRIPISQYVGYMRYFPAEEWRQCMRDYGLDMTAVTNSQSLIGRDVELSQWHDAAVAQQNIAICGPPGIGKTVFGHALLRAYETAHGKRAYMMSGRSIHSFADFVRQLAQILGVATLVPELVQAQLQHVVQREQPYLLITEIDDIQAMTPA